ncbi:MAG: fibrobacter succinogenes major paralogous domain-containing protein [Chitinophagales bacterium]
MTKLITCVVFTAFGFLAFAQTTTVQIGNQAWMAKNLDVSTFRNGDPILQAKNAKEWEDSSLYQRPVWCYYQFNEANNEKYGKFYNWYAVSDPRGLSPAGYHISSREDWNTLNNVLGDDAGKKLKGKAGWNDSGNGTDLYNFNALPGGRITKEGQLYAPAGTMGYWWTSNVANNIFSAFRSLSYNSNQITADYTQRAEGLSVRCVNDTLFDAWPDGKDSVIIGNQVWLARNIRTQAIVEPNGYSSLSIPQAKTKEDWIKLSSTGPAWCYYNFEEKNKEYGLLYNWYAVELMLKNKTLGGKEYRIPTKEDWEALIANLGGEAVSGNQLRSVSGWFENRNGTNQSGFTARPGGSINSSGTSRGIEIESYWWTSTDVTEMNDAQITVPTNRVWVYALDCYNNSVLTVRNKCDGYFIRLVKNKR